MKSAGLIKLKITDVISEGDVLEFMIDNRNVFVDAVESIGIKVGDLIYYSRKEILNVHRKVV